jgi:hypothetical protein
MGWSFPWASSHGSDHNFDLDISRPEKATRAFLAGAVPAVAAQPAQECGTGPAAYLPRRRVKRTYALKDRTVYLTYSTTTHGLELMMGYHRFLNRAPLGRSEGDSPHAATTSTTTRTRRVNSQSPSDRPSAHGHPDHRFGCGASSSATDQWCRIGRVGARSHRMREVSAGRSATLGDGNSPDQAGTPWNGSWNEYRSHLCALRAFRADS